MYTGVDCYHSSCDASKIQEYVANQISNFDSSPEYQQLKDSLGLDCDVSGAYELGFGTGIVALALAFALIM